ncbi:hypothetical protein RB595_003389 [Gaeumannomyces hyphopodioides]
MVADHYDPELQALVRRYSDRLAAQDPASPLNQALHAVATQESDETGAAGTVAAARQRPISWETWITSPGVEESGADGDAMRLHQQCQRLRETWKKFHAHFNLGDVDHLAQNPPTVLTLRQAVSEAQKAWEGKKTAGFGKAKERLESFVGTLHNYSFLFSLIPSDDKYTSLITGTISSIVKISVNHRKIAEIFAQSLEEIDQDIRTVKKSHQISNSREMRYLVVELYVLIFDFLCQAMEWFQNPRHRFIASLSQGYGAKMDGNVAGIKKVVVRIGLEAEQTTQRRVQHTQLGVSSILDEVQALRRASDQRDEALHGIDARLQELSSQIRLGLMARESLLATGQQVNYVLANFGARGVRPSDNKVKNDAAESGEAAEAKQESICQAVKLRREEIECLMGPVDAYYLSTRAGKQGAGSPTGIPGAMLPQEVSIKIERWMRVPSSQIVWVEGPVSTHCEERLTKAAEHIMSLVLEAGIACVSFFGRPRLRRPSGTPAPGDVGEARLSSVGGPAGPPPTSREVTATALLYSVVAQLVHLLPSEFDCPASLRYEEAFGALDGSPASHPAALDLIRAMLPLSPPTLVLVFDRLNLADGVATRPVLTALVKLLRAHGAGTGRVVKAIFTTSGSCSLLAKTLEKGEKVDAGRMAQARPGQPLKGWSLSSGLGMRGKKPEASEVEGSVTPE